MSYTRLWKALAITASSITLLWTLLFPRVAKAGWIDGKIFNAWNGQTSDSTNVECIINDGSSGIQYSKVPEFGEPGEWYAISGNFSPEPDPNANPPDTIKMSATLDVNGKKYITHMQRTYEDENTILPTAFLEDTSKAVRAHSFGAWKVVDISNVNDTLRAEGWLAKNKDQKIPFLNYYLRALGQDSMKVDTSDIYPQVYLNTQVQDSLWNVGDSVFVRLFKTLGDTIWQTVVGFPLDTLKHGCATMLDSIAFPSDRIITDLTPPTINNVTEWPDTSYLGPFPVQATITDGSGIDTTKTLIVWQFNASDPESGNADSVVGNIFHFTVPSVAGSTFVEYRIAATDASPNSNIAYWPGPSPEDWWSFAAQPVGVEERQTVAAPDRFVLFSPVPNPSMRSVVVGYGLPEKTSVTLMLYDLSGRLVNTIWCGTKEKGYHETGLKCKGLGRGIYFIRLEAGHFSAVRKLIILG